MCNQIGIWAFTKLFGKLVGKDRFNNSYYQGRGWASGKRWVLLQMNNKQIAKEWFNWLYRKEDNISPLAAPRKITQKTHQTHYQRWEAGPNIKNH